MRGEQDWGLGSVKTGDLQCGEDLSRYNMTTRTKIDEISKKEIVLEENMKTLF